MIRPGITRKVVSEVLIVKDTGGAVPCAAHFRQLGGEAEAVILALGEGMFSCDNNLIFNGHIDFPAK